MNFLCEWHISQVLISSAKAEQLYQSIFYAGVLAERQDNLPLAIRYYGGAYEIARLDAANRERSGEWQDCVEHWSQATQCLARVLCELDLFPIAEALLSQLHAELFQYCGGKNSPRQQRETAFSRLKNSVKPLINLAARGKRQALLQALDAATCFARRRQAVEHLH